MKLHESKNTFRFGTDPATASGAVILLHGRGGSAEDIAGLSREIPGKLAFAAPQAAAHSWYPQRFFAPVQQNEPWLSSALEVIEQQVEYFRSAGLPDERIGLAGFSQGACLALEYLFRNPVRLGFVAALSGALIGPLRLVRARGDLKRTPVLLGCAEHDEFIPLPHVQETDGHFTGANAQVTKIIFPGSQHGVFPEEMEWIRKQTASWK